MGNEFGQMFDLGWKLLLVLGLAVLALRGLRWLSSPAVGPKSPLQILSRLPVGPQQAVILVAVGRKQILLGQSPQQLTLLAELSEEDLANIEVDSHSHMPRSPQALASLSLLSLWQQFRPQTNRRQPEPEKSNDGLKANQSESILRGLQQALMTPRRNGTTTTEYSSSAPIHDEITLPPERGASH